MKRKHIGAALLLSVCLAFGLAACGGSAQDIDVTAAADAIRSGTTFTDDMTKTETANAERLYGLSDDVVADACVYIGTGATPEEIAVWKAKDESGVETIRSAVDSRLDAQRARFTDYNPEQMPKLESAVVEESGNVVALCISADSETAQSAVDAALISPHDVCKPCFPVWLFAGRPGRLPCTSPEGAQCLFAFGKHCVLRMGRAAIFAADCVFLCYKFPIWESDRASACTTAANSL